MNKQHPENDANNHQAVFVGNSKLLVKVMRDYIEENGDAEQEWKLNRLDLIRWNSINSREASARVLQEIAAFYALLMDRRVDIRTLEEDNYHETLIKYNKNLRPGELHIPFLDTLEDATTSIITNWNKPPFKDLQKTQDLVQIIIAVR